MIKQNGTFKSSIIKFAAKHNVELNIEDNIVEFYKSEEDSEYGFSYSIQNNELFFEGRGYISADDKNELPYWIPNTDKLQEVIEFFATMK